MMGTIVFAMLDGVGALGALCGGVIGEWDLHFAFAFAGAMAGLSALLAFYFSFSSSRAPVVVTP